MISLHRGWVTRVRVARAACHARRGGIRIGWIVGVEPEHVGLMVIPKAQYKNHTLRHRLVHGSEPTVCEEVCLVLKKVQLRLAKSVLTESKVPEPTCNDGV